MEKSNGGKKEMMKRNIKISLIFGLIIIILIIA